MKIETLNDVYLDNLKDLYSAENQLISALPKMAKAAESEELRTAFQEHLEQTRGHVERLDKVFQQLGKNPKGKKCKAMEGLIEEGKEVISNMDEASPARDAALIAAAQRVEHYEIAGYGCVRTFARVLGDEKSANLLQQTLDEEAETDEKLTSIAEGLVNEQASVGESEGEEEE